MTRFWHVLLFILLLRPLVLPTQAQARLAMREGVRKEHTALVRKATVHPSAVAAMPPQAAPAPFEAARLFKLRPVGAWTEAEYLVIESAVTATALRLAQATGREAADIFLAVYGGLVEFRRTPACPEALVSCAGLWGWTETPTLIWVLPELTPSLLAEHPRWGVHELGHAFSFALAERPEQLPDSLLDRSGFAGALNDWQYSSAVSGREIFADMFVAWVFAQWGTPGGPGTDKAGWIALHLGTWLEELQ